MLFPIRAPRVNNNDDEVRLRAVLVQPGAHVRVGDIVAEVETDKATVAVEADRAGFYLSCPHAEGDTVAVGSVLVWMGENAEDAPPEQDAIAPPAGRSAEPTLKAALLLREYGIDASQVPAASDRLSVAEVQAYITSHALLPKPARGAAATSEARRPLSLQDVPSDIQDLSVIERGMLRTVKWHRDEAVPGHIEIAYDASAWDEYAAAFQREHKLLMNPVLSLMAYRLVAVCAANAKCNATVHEERKVLYKSVNIGFTVQSGDNLYLTVLANADRMSEREFVSRLLELQKAAMKNRLEASQTSGATIGFTSMARWGVVRHQPILPPFTSLMVAHAAPSNGQSALGATYDHRLLSGADVVAALNIVKAPPVRNDT